MGRAVDGGAGTGRSATMCLTAVAILSLGCGDSVVGPEPSPPFGSITVAISTTGNDFDTNGYRVVMGSERTVLVGPSAVIVLGQVTPGRHELTLEGVADNCSVVDEQPLSVVVTAGVETVASFVVRCDATGVLIRAHTTGVDQPLSIGVLVGEETGSVAANGFVVLSRIAPGHQVVTLQPPGNCTIAGDNPVDVEVANREVSSVVFELTCTLTHINLAFVVDSVSGNSSVTWISVADSNGAAVRPLAPGNSPSWSHDGKTVVFSDYECGYEYFYDWVCHGGIVIMDPETRAAITPKNASLGFEPSLSPDGNSIAFLKAAEYGKLYVAGMDGSAAVRIEVPVVEVRHPTWSPDSKTIAFQCRVEFGDLEICAINSDGTGFKRLTTNRFTDDKPVWSPDGSKIAFWSTRPEQWGFGNPAIVVMSLSGVEDPPLTLGTDPAWSPSGARMVFAGNNGLFTINADGSNLQRITTGGHRAPAWRP